MMMNFNQAGQAVPVNDPVVSEMQEDYTRIGEMAKMFGVTLRALRTLKAAAQTAEMPQNHHVAAA